jgi:hypothetical protein
MLESFCIGAHCFETNGCASAQEERGRVYRIAEPASV